MKKYFVLLILTVPLLFFGTYQSVSAEKELQNVESSQTNSKKNDNSQEKRNKTESTQKQKTKSHEVSSEDTDVDRESDSGSDLSRDQKAEDPETVQGSKKSDNEVEDQEEDQEDKKLNKNSVHYESGDSGQHIVELKEKLVKLGFASWSSPSKYFGPITSGVIEDFQSNYDLPVTGTADPETRSKIDEILTPPYQDGDRGAPVIELKEKLVELGFAGWSTPSQFYGSITASKVKAFQRQLGLTQDGIAGEETLKQIENSLEQGILYDRGDSGQHIVELKEKLVKLGFATWSSPTKYFGPITSGVVEDFQSNYDLPVTGTANPETRSKIDEILTPPYQDGDRGAPVIELKEKLVELGFAGWSNPSQFYGSITASKVKAFQRQLGLTQDGIAGEETLKQIENSLEQGIPYGRGDSGQHIVELKEKLVKLGFATWSSPTKYFGPITSGVVEDFQSNYHLPVTGAADPETRSKVDEILDPPYQNGDQGKHIVELKEKLVKLGFATWSSPTMYYGTITSGVVKSFQKQHDLSVTGLADKKTITKIRNLAKVPTNTKYDITLDKAVNKQMNASPQTGKNQAWVSKSYVNNGKVTASVLNVRTGPGTNNASVGQVTKGQSVDVIGEHNGWYTIEYDHNRQWAHASPDQVKHHLDPNNFADDIRQKYQFLDLSRVSSASKNVLNNHLKGKGTLAGEGEAFIDAGQRHGVNDVYLISHAKLETGNGSSRLAQGVKVGKTNSGDLKLVTPNNKSNLKNTKKVYNMFGVHAFDNCALECGAKKAYKENWTSPYKAIVGGSAFIGNNYVKKGQNTIYKMRWNPAAMENGAPAHQYATDVGWASKQINTIYNLYETMKIGAQYLDIPQYK